MDTGITFLGVLGEPDLVDLKVVVLEIAPSIGHKTDPEHSDLQTMLKLYKIADLPLDNSPQFSTSSMISVGFLKHRPIICWNEQMYISSGCHLAASVEKNSN